MNSKKTHVYNFGGDLVTDYSASLAFEHVFGGKRGYTETDPLSAPLLDLNSFESRWNLINKGGVNIKVK